MQLTQQQNNILDAIKSFLTSDTPIFILCGYAGTGKTTMAKVIADYVIKSSKLFLMAPTGRAARVLSQKTGREATTIHRAIYSKAYVVTKDTNDIAKSEIKLKFPIVDEDHSGRIVAIVDEASMVSSKTMGSELFSFGTDNLMEDLLTFVRPHHGGKVIFIGDPVQLPPVGEATSNALNPDYFKEKGLQVEMAELTEVLRQKADSLILKNAMAIRNLLQNELRNYLIFDEKAGEVEMLEPAQLLPKYFENRQAGNPYRSVVITFSNRIATQYNKDIRQKIYGGDVPIQVGDILMVAQNNYLVGKMNGEFVPVLSVGERFKQSAPVYVDRGGKNERIVIELNFVQVTIPDTNGNPFPCLLIEDFLTSEKASLPIDVVRALYINFRIRNKSLTEGTKAFADALFKDKYYNALRAKYGYAVTGHKCQGGEWQKVFVDYSARTGTSNDCLRWAYTATTRAQETLYVTNLPRITPFSKFRIEQVQRCKKVAEEFRMLAEVSPTPFHSAFTPNFLRAKYQCIVENMEGTPYSVFNVTSQPYREIYQVRTPDGIDRYDITYNGRGIFSSAGTAAKNKYVQEVLSLLNDERAMPTQFLYKASDDLRQNLYNLIRSACDGLSISITNVVEHPEDYSVIFYFSTCGQPSYLKVYINTRGYVSYAKPMSMFGTNDNELKALLNELYVHLI